MYPTLVAMAFFLWVGVFNLMIIAQFWSFANDLYTPEQGKRLFAILGFGGSVGAIGGSLIASTLIARLGVLPMMLRRRRPAADRARSSTEHDSRARAAAPAKLSRPRVEHLTQPLGKAGGFKLVLSQRYLLLIGLLTLTVNLVNTNGNYILNETLARMAERRCGGSSGGLRRADHRQLHGWTRFLAERALDGDSVLSGVAHHQVLGVGGALFILPMLALGSYGLFAFAPVLAFIRLTKIAENATDYSIQNTVRRALFLPTSREAKYKALQAVETFFWRAGDMLSAHLDLRASSVAGALGSSFAIVESRARCRVAGAGRRVWQRRIDD